MSNSTTFVDAVTPIKAAWLNDVNTAVYTDLGGPGALSTTAGSAKVGTPALTGLPGTTVASQLGQIATALSAVSQAATITTIPDFTLTGANANTSSSTSINYTTNANGWNVGPGKVTLTTEFTLTNYIATNPNSHFGFILRSSTASPVNGHGTIFGQLNSPISGASTGYRLALETWYPASAGGGNYVFSQENLAFAPTLADGVHYHLTSTSTVTPEGLKYVRAVLHQLTATGVSDSYWQLLADTGDVLDHNTLADFTQTDFGIFSVFNSTLTGWSIAFTNTKMAWSAASTIASDQSRGVSFNSGVANVPGDINFVGDSRRIKTPSAGTNPSLWTAFQNSNSNSSTSILAMPNGTGTTANFSAVSTSTPTSAYRMATYGMAGTNAQIETFGIGLSDPPLNVNVGVSNTVATFNSTGMKFPGASTNVNYPWTTTFNQFGGANAVAYATGVAAATIPVEWWCTAGNIASQLSNPPTPAQVETVLRPLYCMVSALTAQLQSKKVL